MPISNARHARARTIATVVAVAVCMLILPTEAHASHVGTVSITPAVGTVVADVCGPFLVQTQGGSDPIGAVVDVEVVGATPVEFCLPASGVNPVLIDPATGDRGGGSDGTIGGEATADASALPGEGAFTFGIVSPASGSFDITVFVEEPGGPNDNDDPDGGEPQDTASLTVGSGGGGGGGGGNVRSTITISGTFEGQVRSSDAVCEQSRKVVVKRVKEGPDRVVGRDVTDQSGAYRVSAQNPSGRFYAIATKKAGGASGGSSNCLKARSKKVRR